MSSDHQISNSTDQQNAEDEFVQLSRADLINPLVFRQQQNNSNQQHANVNGGIDSSSDNQKCSYEDDLWDSLPQIHLNHRKGVQMLTGFTNFCKNYTKVLQNFSAGMLKCGESFEKEMLTQNSFDTTAIAITNVKQGLEEIVKQVHEKINMVFGDIVEPLDLYQKHYIATSIEQINQAKFYWNNLENGKKKLVTQQDKYYRLMNEVEQSEINIEQALLEFEKGDLSLDQVQKITNQTLNIKYKAEIASQDYRREVDLLNILLAKFQDDYKPLLSRLQQGEESRINFLKYNLEKFVKHFGGLGKQITEKSSDIQNSVSMINSETDLRIFIDENKTNTQFMSKVEYKAYEHSKEVQKQKADLIHQINQQKLSNNFQQLEDELKKNELDEHKLLEYLQSLMRGQDISFDSKGEIISSLHSSRVREAVADFLKSINSPKLIDNAEALKTLGEILKYMLTAYVHEKDENYKVVYAILHSSHQIFHLKQGDIQEKQKVYLTSYLSDHGIWQEQTVWRVCIQKIINQKFHEAIQSPGVLASKNQQQQLQPPSPQHHAPVTGLFGQLGKLKGLWGQSNKDDHSQVKQDAINNQNKISQARIPKTLAQNIIFNSISKFLYHFVNFQLPFDASREVLLYFCNKYELDQNRTHLLLSELESIQRKSTFTITEKDKIQIYKMKIRKREKKHGNGIQLIIAFTIKFFANDYELSKFLLLSKLTKQRLQNVVYKQALTGSQLNRLRIKRTQIWDSLLKLNDNKSDYKAFRNKVMQNSHIITNVEEVINMDVQRSFTKMKDIDPTVLTNILKTYAFFNPEIEYCQGMNFIAGFLFIVFRDEEKSFKALQDLVEVHDMAELFNTELPKLKLYFYQFDRLLSIFLPQLHSHFKDEMINSSYYSSAWFITIFTNSLQNQEGPVLSEKLLQLWDYFLTSGWKSIFKMGLYVLKENEQDLLKMNFEQILNFITEKPKQLLSEYITPGDNDTILYHELKHCFKDLANFDYILERLEKEFKNSLEAAIQIKKQQQLSPDKYARSQYQQQVEQDEEEKESQ